MQYIYQNAEDIFALILALINGQIDSSIIPVIIRLAIALF